MLAQSGTSAGAGCGGHAAAGSSQSCYLRGHHVPHRLDVPDGRGVLVLRGTPRQAGRGGHPAADRLRPDVGCNGDGNICKEMPVKCTAAPGRTKPEGQRAQPEGPKKSPHHAQSGPWVQGSFPRTGRTAIPPAGLLRFSAEGRRAGKGTFSSRNACLHQQLEDGHSTEEGGLQELLPPAPLLQRGKGRGTRGQG